MHIINPYRYGGGGGPGTTLVQDTFTDSNGTALGSHTPDVDLLGGGWIDVTVGMEIQSNKLVGPGSGNNVASVLTSASDVESSVVGVVSTSAGNNSIGLVLRFTDADNFWLCDFTSNTIGDVRTARIFERNGATYIARGSSSGITHTRGAPIEIKAIANGSTIDLYVPSDTLEVTYASATFQQTEKQHGIRADNSLQTHDDFTVKTI